MAVHHYSPSNLLQLVKLCKEDWEKPPKYRCAKLVASYTKILEALIAAKDDSRKYSEKAILSEK